MGAITLDADYLAHLIKQTLAMLMTTQFTKRSIHICKQITGSLNLRRIN